MPRFLILNLSIAIFGFTALYKCFYYYYYNKWPDPRGMCATYMSKTM